MTVRQRLGEFAGSLSRLKPNPPAFIDVKQLILQLSDEQLLASADAYFSGLTLDSEQCNKPFSNPKDVAHVSRSLAMLFEAADLFPNADVLDFGCATGWLTLAMANMGCKST